MSKTPEHYSMPQTAEAFFSEIAARAEKQTLHHATPEFWQAYANTVKFDQIVPWLRGLDIKHDAKSKAAHCAVVAHLFLRVQRISKEKPSIRRITQQANQALPTARLTEDSVSSLIKALGIRKPPIAALMPPASNQTERYKPTGPRYHTPRPAVRSMTLMRIAEQLAAKGTSPEEIVTQLNETIKAKDAKAPLYAPDMLTQTDKVPSMPEQKLRHAFRRGQSAASALKR